MQLRPHRTDGDGSGRLQLSLRRALGAVPERLRALERLGVPLLRLTGHAGHRGAPDAAECEALAHLTLHLERHAAELRVTHDEAGEVAVRLRDLLGAPAVALGSRLEVRPHAAEEAEAEGLLLLLAALTPIGGDAVVQRLAQGSVALRTSTTRLGGTTLSVLHVRGSGLLGNGAAVRVLGHDFS